MILKKITSSEILEYQTKFKGMKKLLDDGILKVLEGKTSLEELISCNRNKVIWHIISIWLKIKEEER